MNEVTTKALQQVYLKNSDKQRITLIGGHAHTIFKMIKHVLAQLAKKADYLTDDQLNNHELPVFTEAPVLLFCTMQLTEETKHFNSHVIILTNPLEKSQLTVANLLVNALPKSGILIADDREPAATVAKKEIPDVLIINFKAYPHIINSEAVSLITSTHEKVLINIGGEENLRCISAAKETLKKIGVSSGQFYRAIATFTI